MNASEFLSTILDPGLAWCATVPGWVIKPDDRARVLLLAIAGQESAWSHRIQGGPTPAAHGFFQFERNGGVKGVLTHAATWKMATAACANYNIPSNAANAWGIMATEKGDHLAVAFGRLLLWTDPHPLPGFGAMQTAWGVYERLWRPGRPRPDAWPDNYDAALDAVTGEQP